MLQTNFRLFCSNQSGEIIKNSRTFVMPYDKPMTFTTLFRYDSWNRIKKIPDAMELGLTYGPSGEILSKIQDHEHNGQPVALTTYAMNYTYSGSQPHAASTIGNMDYTYDGNGNVIEGFNTKDFTSRHFVWDEENRLKLFCDHEVAGSYLYEDKGERYLKIIGNHISQVINGNTTIEGYAEESQTLYVNPYMVVTPSEYTKHYCIENERIASKIGGGLDVSENNINGGETDVAKIYQKPFIGVDTYKTLFGFHLQSETDFKDKADSIQEMLNRDLANIGEGNYLSFNILLRPLMQQELERNDVENLRYFYHPDHLGSSSCVSDIMGYPSQHLEYFPFGETFVDENIGSYNTPYKFNAKELDMESGLYYYGARYYIDRESIWLGVDPMADQRSWVSPYSYCQNNPIGRIDPTGDLDGWVEGADGIVFWDAKTNSQEEFAINYKGRTNYSYASDKDNPNAYTLPNGEGKLLLNSWDVYPIENGCVGPKIALEFLPSCNSSDIGWLQTFSSNIPDANSGDVWYKVPGANLEDRVDFQSVDKNNSRVPYWNPAKDSRILTDMPMRKYNEGATTSVKWNAQSSVIVNGVRSLTVGWGFTINSMVSGSFTSPWIINNPSPFHLNTIISLK